MIHVAVVGASAVLPLDALHSIMLIMRIAFARTYQDRTLRVGVVRFSRIADKGACQGVGWVGMWLEGHGASALVLYVKGGWGVYV